MGLPYSCKGDRDDCQNSLEENLTTGYQNRVLGQSSGTVGGSMGLINKPFDVLLVWLKILESTVHYCTFTQVKIYLGTFSDQFMQFI